LWEQGVGAGMSRKPTGAMATSETHGKNIKQTEFLSVKKRSF